MLYVDIEYSLSRSISLDFFLSILNTFVFENIFELAGSIIMHNVVRLDCIILRISVSKRAA